MTMMKNRSGAVVGMGVSAALAMILFTGCALPSKSPPSPTRDRAYVVYWPPPAESKELRLAVKDLIDMKGVVTTAGSEFLAKNGPPARRDAECLAIARERKVRIVGKTNLTELAVGVSGINQYFGTPRNPLGKRRRLIPGGSSSGSAVAIANGTADVSFGTDTAGSVRVPAASCGIAGLKTTFGLVSLKGVYPISPTHLDTVGPMARDVKGLAQGMDLLQRGFAGRYRTAVSAKPSAGQIKIGRLYLAGTDPRIDRAVDDALAAAGFKVVVLGRGFKDQWEQAQKDGRTIAAADAWLYDQQFKDQPQVNSRTKAVFALGAVEYHTRYREALKRRAAWQASLRRVFREVDFIALPTLQTLPSTVPLFGGTVAFEALVVGQQNTAAVNYAGNPALALPIPVADKKAPLTSVQLIGRPRSEAELLNAGRLIEAKL